METVAFFISIVRHKHKRRVDDLLARAKSLKKAAEIIKRIIDMTGLPCEDMGLIEPGCIARIEA